MTHIQQVIESLSNRRRATIDDIRKDWPDMTADQVIKALQNAAARGLAQSLGKVEKDTPLGRRQVAVYSLGGKRAGTEGPRNDWPHGRPASVWDYGQGISR